jgi:hypothetical protein
LFDRLACGLHDRSKATLKLETPLKSGVSKGEKVRSEMSDTKSSENEYRRLMNPVRTANALGIEEVIDSSYT